MANANFTCVLDAWNDGKVLYGRMHYYRSGSYYYQDSTFPDPTMNLGGVTYSDSAFGARVRSGIYVGDVYTTTFSRTVGGSGNRTVTFSAGSGQRSDFAGSWSKTVYIPESYSPPTGLNVTIAEIYPRGAKFNVSISSYGNPSSASGRWIEAGIAGQNAWQSPSLRSAVVQNSTSAQITVDNNSTQTTTLTVQPNIQYYYGGYATNTQRSASVVKGQFVTTAEAPTVTLNSVTSTTATFDYTANADGGYYNKTIEYSVDNGATWQTGATITGGSATSGSFTVNNLLSGADYILMVRVSTTSGSTTGTSVSFQTEAIIQRNKCVYGSVSGTEARQITDLYGSSNNGAQRITKLYSGIEDVDQWVITSIENNPGIDLAKFMSMLRSIHGPITNYADKPGTLSAVPDPVSQSRVDMYLAGRGDSAYLFSYTFGSYAGEGASWGFPSEPQLGRVTSSYERPIISKLIHQGFGHLSYN